MIAFTHLTGDMTVCIVRYDIRTWMRQSAFIEAIEATFMPRIFFLLDLGWEDH